MSSKTTAVRVRPGEPEAHGPAGAGARALGWLATAAIIAAILVMIGASLLRGSWMPPRLPMPGFGPPWELSSVHFSFRVIVVALWLAAILGGAGVAAGLVAVRRGMPLPIRTLLVAALLGVAVLTVLPPVGSTDPLDYAVYGHIAALGRSPYFVTPAQYLHQLHGLPGVPLDWRYLPSVYGPLATLEQLAAAKLGGASLAATVFWLKLVNALAFVGIALVADRLLRADRASSCGRTCCGPPTRCCCGA